MVFKCANTVAGAHGAHSGTWGNLLALRISTEEDDWWQHLSDLIWGNLIVEGFPSLTLLWSLSESTEQVENCNVPRNAFSVLHLTTRKRSNCWTIYYSRYSPFWLCSFPSVLLWTPFSVKLWGWECWARVRINTQVQTSSCSISDMMIELVFHVMLILFVHICMCVSKWMYMCIYLFFCFTCPKLKFIIIIIL